MKNIARVVASFVLVIGAALLASSFVSPQSTSWYGSLAKPTFTPPDWIIAPVWFIVYVLMAIALARVWSLLGHKHKPWIFAFCIQLLFSVLWAVLFFQLHSLWLSVIDVIILWFAVVVLTLNSWEIDNPSFWLLIPYLASVTFAMIFNVAIWWMN